jgi:hypothetical protein|tara:strand:+ start:16064 stop:16240 length:177 start_codon:yes stop_codon:yes gene_type:complete
MIEYTAFFVLMIGAAWSSYLIGVKDGGAKMIDMLEIVGIINVDDNDNVTPNKLYNPKN